MHTENCQNDRKIHKTIQTYLGHKLTSKLIINSTSKKKGITVLEETMFK